MPDTGSRSRKSEELALTGVKYVLSRPSSFKPILPLGRSCTASGRCHVNLQGYTSTRASVNSV
jgi:hypothetical protein